MKSETVQTLTATFEACAQQTENGIEFWLARDLQQLLGYTEWRNFTLVIHKARTACEVSGHPITDHFVDVNKMVDLARVPLTNSQNKKSCGTPQQALPIPNEQRYSGHPKVMQRQPPNERKSPW